MDTRHIFILNPRAGTRDARERLEAQLAALPHLRPELYVTTGTLDAARYAALVAKETVVPTLLYACGGDGTLGEVAQGAVNAPLVSVAAWPCGSGNDYTRMYGGREPFLDIAALAEAQAVAVDAIRVGERVSINVVNIGLEAYAANAVAAIRYNPLLGGKRAYYYGAAKAALANPRVECEITADGELLHRGALMTASFASGRYIGGGFLCAPRAQNDDGLLEVTAIRPLTRLGIARLIGIYKRGDHLTHPAFAPYVAYTRAKNVRVSCEKPTAVCLDGEITTMRDFTLELLPGAVRFAVPRGAKA